MYVAENNARKEKATKNRLGTTSDNAKVRFMYYISKCKIIYAMPSLR